MMIVYGSTLSPYVRKVMACAAEKGIEIDLQPTGFPDHSPGFLEASPFRKMPALRDGDFCSPIPARSSIIWKPSIPQPALIPSDPELRGKTIWFEEFADTILVSCGAKIFFNRIVAPRFHGAAWRHGSCRSRRSSTTCHRSLIISKRPCRTKAAIWLAMD